MSGGLTYEEMAERSENAPKYRVVVSRPFINLVMMQVCCVADATDEEILEVCNTQNPSGTSRGWVEVIREGEGAPGVCERYPDRLHILVSC